ASLLGGLVGENGLFNLGSGSIASSSASGNVNGDNGINTSLGGLAGFNSPGSTITASSASGKVTSSATVIQTHPNAPASNSCQKVSAGGLVGENFGTIIHSSAGGSIAVGSNGTGGGLVGFNAGIIASASATGNVTGAAGSKGINGQGGTTTLGGLVGINQGLISGSSASGNVGNANVSNLQAGGLVGDNSGTIVSANAAGNVQAGSGSIAGGLVQLAVQQCQLPGLHECRWIALLQHRAHRRLARERQCRHGRGQLGRRLCRRERRRHHAGLGHRRGYG